MLEIVSRRLLLNSPIVEDVSEVSEWRSRSSGFWALYTVTAYQAKA